VEKTGLDMTELADVVVLGLGPGGEEVAGRLAQAGLEVVGIDAELVGGECPYWGCVPSKMMIRASGLLEDGRRINGMAGNATVVSDWAPVATRIRDEATDNWDDKVAVERLESKGARFVRGWGRLDGDRRVVVDDLEFEARLGVVVNTGCRAWFPPIPGLKGLPYWTNREAIETTALPRSLLVMGGGGVGVELAQMFSRFGSEVTVVEAGDRLVPTEEPEASELLARVFEAQGIRVVTDAEIASASGHDGDFALDLGPQGTLRASSLLVATGRRPDLHAIGTASVGIDESGRTIPTDDRMRAGPGLWAIGDVTGKGAFTHMSMYQAEVCIADILDSDFPPADYRAVPRVTFTDPEIGSVGMTESDARKSGVSVTTGFSDVTSSARGWIHKVGNDGFVKLVCDTDRGVLVGATSVGPTGGEVLSMLTLAVHAQVPITRLRDMIYAYPTFHLAVLPAVKELFD
jgi:pyruvate/2-oxoglutarate dehydrogenase complex dihydrolipoamide dehydrogenase (E3) component